MLEQLKEFGTAYMVGMALVIIVAVIDVISAVHCFKKHPEDLHDYAEVMIKYGKIIVIAMLGVYFILQTFDSRILPSVKALHIAIGVIAIADSAAGLFIKLKFSRKGSGPKGMM